MTVGSRTVTGPHYYGYTEAILYRTQTEILTDQRILLDGKTYTFDQIDAVDVVRLKLYIPFQIIRLVAVIIMLGCAWLTFASMQDAAFISMFLYGLIAAGSGVFAFVSASLVPTHAIRLKVGTKKVYMMHDTSVPYLERVKAAVVHGMNHQ